MQRMETTSIRAIFYAFGTRISYILDQSYGLHPGTMASALIGVLLIAAPSLQAQSSNAGDIRGTVTDSSGAVIPGVAVTITNVLSGVVSSNSTNRAGLYDAISLLPGSYNLQFTKDGFQTFVRTGVTLGGDPISVNAKLAVGSQSEEVTVSGAIAAIDTESGQQSQTITEKQITELPSAGMNWENTTQLLPSTSAGGGSGVQIEGVQAYQTNFLINGGELFCQRVRTSPGRPRLTRSRRSKRSHQISAQNMAMAPL